MVRRKLKLSGRNELRNEDKEKAEKGVVVSSDDSKNPLYWMRFSLCVGGFCVHELHREEISVNGAVEPLIVLSEKSFFNQQRFLVTRYTVCRGTNGGSSLGDWELEKIVYDFPGSIFGRKVSYIDNDRS